jgi:hypothetical protein
MMISLKKIVLGNIFKTPPFINQMMVLVFIQNYLIIIRFEMISCPF